ncbi:hypothetical protein BD780_001003 [Clostridium tetanomorphum]|nr:hypothetical protein [Clostridium tetanomorphum]NRS83778.1 hypothetical protein [Clostridium tetanomorphum]
MNIKDEKDYEKVIALLLGAGDMENRTINK